MSVATIDDSGGNQLNEGPSTASLFTALMLSQQPSTSSAASLKCGYCGQLPVQLHPCLFCGTVTYCSAEHQKFHWNTHKMLCNSLTASGLVSSNLMPATTAPRTVSFDDPTLAATSLLLSLQSNPLLTHAVSSFQPTFSIVPQTESEPIPQRNPLGATAFGSEKSAFKPYRSTHVFNSLSSESIASLGFASQASLDHMSSASLAMFPSSSTAQSDISNLATISAQVLSLAKDSSAPIGLGVPSTLSTLSMKKEPIVVGKEKFIPTDDPDIQIIETEGSSSKGISRPRKRPTPSNSADPKIKYKDHSKNCVYSTTLQEHQRHIQSRGMAFNQHHAMILRLKYIAEHVIRSLNEFGWAVVDNFMGKEKFKYTAKEIEMLHSRGLFSPGQLMEGKNKDEVHIKDIRSDHIYWFDGCDERAKDAASTRFLISMIDSVIKHFNKRIDHNIGGRSRAMLAIYPGDGTRYVKHVDNPVKDGRCITTIYYCNDNWDMTKDGGALRLYPETSKTPMDIDPRADRLVFFWSDRRNPHEVMPVYRHRYAITIWYMDRSERDRAMARGKEADAASAAKKENDPTLPRKNPSSHDLSPIDFGSFPTTSSDPGLASREDRVEVVSEFTSSSSLTAPESTDSGVSLSALHDGPYHPMDRAGSLQSISDHFRSGERRSSTSSDQELDEGLPPPPSADPEFMI
ncbi:unnamed protein product [Caenorhabditis sp. 36 PRJEB53466]|nr:unnamed protein product [Caenorhabditis sp. 36 PRJEB53466]